MRSVERIMRLANRFERSLRKHAAVVSSDKKATVSDALFGSGNDNNNDAFLNKKLLKSDSKLQAALQGVDSKVWIGGDVDVPNQKAEILVKCIPGVRADVLAKIKAAVLQDYKDFYGNDPVGRMKKRLEKKDIEDTAVARWEEIIEF